VVSTVATNVCDIIVGPASVWVMMVELLLIFKIATTAIATEVGIFWIPSPDTVLLVGFAFVFGAKHMTAIEASTVC
jgi:hypothetical protein